MIPTVQLQFIKQQNTPILAVHFLIMTMRSCEHARLIRRARGTGTFQHLSRSSTFPASLRGRYHKSYIDELVDYVTRRRSFFKTQAKCKEAHLRMLHDTCLWSPYQDYWGSTSVGLSSTINRDRLGLGPQLGCLVSNNLQTNTSISSWQGAHAVQVPLGLSF